ncbi:lipoprotein [Serinicoccus hydrothermalis]|uniref:Lipoprotein n=1 Tax=Serinicoccus hydrothermalis TaxID=1758689 RepID=A0A1B1N7M0_9MICO|nr:lipoprotein [Serinicoccus hydrothermalis]
MVGRLAAIMLVPSALLGCTAGPARDLPTTTPAAPTPAASAPSTAAASSEEPADPTVSPDAARTTDPGPQDGAFEITIAATGDILPHHAVNESARAYAEQGRAGAAFDYSPMLADVRDLLGAADLTLCHLETPLSADDTALTAPDVLAFNSPHEVAEALADAGVDGCDFASNHTMDRGLEGLAATEQVVRGAGMGYAGPTASQDRAGEAELYEVPVAGRDDVTVAHLAYTYTYPNDGSPTTHVPGEAPWLELASWPSIGSEGIREQARAARAAGVDVVVVSMHWGQEYQVEPTQDQTRLARELLGSPDVDAVLGTHVHVVQPCERIDGGHVLYGMGNFLSNQGHEVNPALAPGTQEGMVAVLTVRGDEGGAVTTELAYHPTRVEITPEGPSHVVRLVRPESAPETWERTTSAVDLLGGCGARALASSTLTP